MSKLLALFGTILMAALVSTAPAAVAKAITVIDMEKTGTIAIGAASKTVQYEGGNPALQAAGITGVNAVYYPIKPSMIGKDFSVVATGGTPGVSGIVDFDLKWNDYGGVATWTSSEGNEAGKVPAGAAGVTIVLMDGADASFRFVVSHVEQVG